MSLEEILADTNHAQAIDHGGQKYPTLDEEQERMERLEIAAEMARRERERAKRARQGSVDRWLESLGLCPTCEGRRAEGSKYCQECLDRENTPGRRHAPKKAKRTADSPAASAAAPPAQAGAAS